MPPLAPVPDTLRTVIEWSDGSDALTTSTQYWGYSGSAPDATDCNSFATTLAGLYAAHATLWDIDSALVGVTVTDLATPSGAQGAATSGTQGTRSGDTLAGGTAVLLNFQLSRRYRGGKPRNYLPWGVAGDLATRQGWDGSFIAAVGTAWTAISSGFIGQTEGGCTIANHANVSYYENSTVVISPTTGRARNVPTRRIPPLAAPTTGFSVSITPGSQRRRNRS